MVMKLLRYRENDRYSGLVSDNQRLVLTRDHVRLIRDWHEDMAAAGGPDAETHRQAARILTHEMV